MCAAEETDIGTKHGSGANGDKACVNDDAVKIDENTLPQLHIVAVVDADWCLNPWLMLKQ